MKMIWESQFEGRRCKADGWYGYVALPGGGKHLVCFVFQEGKDVWYFHCYIGRARPGKRNAGTWYERPAGAGYGTGGLARRAAERWWRGCVGLWSGVGCGPVRRVRSTGFDVAGPGDGVRFGPWDVVLTEEGELVVRGPGGRLRLGGSGQPLTMLPPGRAAVPGK